MRFIVSSGGLRRQNVSSEVDAAAAAAGVEGELLLLLLLGKERCLTSLRNDDRTASVTLFITGIELMFAIAIAALLLMLLLLLLRLLLLPPKLSNERRF